ncbi:fibronectin type III domain-containing protein [Mariniflexile gromovii]|uniref:Fibronectin type III domain-containing protein n=1 Tax=Mariniflexile gromovii TaxID=362523 RepID=A0ABS4BSZ0_9FLAO|nr:fibronectin type III domain-containing protein [Mariniflexile gromovii]MBP0903709.1 fibronectin type III domain-containing protein [Mariniflexile gromovii]
MRFIILFLLFSTAAVSQNYHYSLDQQEADVIAPTAPTNVVVSNIAISAVDITWTASTDNVAVTNYNIYNNNTLIKASIGNVTSFTLTGLAPSNNYNITVRALDAAGNISSNSNAQSFSTIGTPDTTPPSNPTGLIVSNITETTADLSWTASTDNIGVVDYQVYNNGILLIPSIGNNGTSVNLTGLTPDTNHSLTLRAIDVAGNISEDSNTINFTTLFVDTVAPSIPTNLVASDITQSSATLTWTASTDNVAVTDYKIYNNGVLLVESTGNVTTYSITGLNANTVYSLTVSAIDDAGNKSEVSTTTEFTTLAVLLAENMREEIPYFKAYLLPLAEKANLQNALDTYGAVRLEKGDYGFNNKTVITMSSNQKLYGHPSLTQTPKIAITSGSSNVEIQCIWNEEIEFLSGAPIKNCLLKSIKWSNIVTTGGMLEDNLFIDVKSSILFDMSRSGYYRNNRVYRHQVHIPLALKILGNSATPSYGNVHVWSNWLTPRAEGVILDNIESITFLGGDSEGWNGSNLTTKAMFTATNMGTLKITDLGGGNGYCPGCETPAWDIQAENLYFYNKYISNVSPYKSVARAGTNVFSVKTLSGTELYDVETGGIHFKAHPSNSDGSQYNSVYLNGVEQTAVTITDPTLQEKLTSMILGPQYTPIERYNWETLPDPLGTNWESERIGKPDSKQYIQNLIDTNTIAELPEGVYYIGSSLTLKANEFINQGIIGSGTGKTVICGITDDFPLITINSDPNLQMSIHLAHLTLQGGSKGIYFPKETRLIAYNIWKYIIFRNQSIGIHFHEMFGFDNNYLEYVNFVNCGTAIFNDGLENTGQDNWYESELGYMDKTFYYRCQFINCDNALELQSYRASGGNTWMECKFDGNKKIGDFSGNNYPIFVNSDFTNNTGGNLTGSFLFEGEPGVFCNSNFSGNSSNYIFNTKGFISYGSNFLDTVTLCSPDVHWDQSFYVFNSTLNGLLGGGRRWNQGCFVNSNFALQPELSKLFVNISDSVNKTIIDGTPNPYPQLFVKH